MGGRPLDVAFGGDVVRFCEDVRSLLLGGALGDELPFCLVCDLDSCARLSDNERCLDRGDPDKLRTSSAAAADSEL